MTLQLPALARRGRSLYFGGSSGRRLEELISLASSGAAGLSLARKSFSWLSGSDVRGVCVYVGGSSNLASLNNFG